MAATTSSSAAPIIDFETSIGTFSVELYHQHAPKTCFNFQELAKIGYYDGCSVHRVIKDFMVQMGDPTGTGRGGESIFGGKFEDEIRRDLKFTGAGILAMANSGPATNGSQFFLTLAPTPWLDGKHTIFGRVCNGMGVVQRMGLVPVGAGDKPLNDVKIYRARVRGENGSMALLQ
jgi:peptidyl-prolyl cis-trans isomerase-like 1